MINKKDMVIISNLRENARQNLTGMSRKTHMPVSTIFDKIRHYENNSKVISGYTCLVDFEQMGYGMRVNLLLKVEKSQRDELSNYLKKHRAINTAYKVNNHFDFLAECIFRNLREMDKFIENLEKQFRISETEVLYVVEEIKREKFMCGQEPVEIIVDDRKAYKTNFAQETA